MPVQFAHPRKTFSTLLALERTIGFVQSAMVAQAARVRKLFTARRTAVPLRPSMSTVHMFFHIVQTCESFSAYQAHVLPGMHPTMVRVLPAAEKLFSAVGAVVWLLAGMVTPVFQEFAGREELLCTYVTDERMFARMLAFVLSHRAKPRKSAAADVTVERTLSRVRAPVLRVLFSTHERLSTVVTDVDHPFSSGEGLLWLRCSAGAASLHWMFNKFFGVL